ncbi:MAG TPA: beta-galactosidase trimerization domain-containing protein, partial [bacterium]|nr:beta-galactosidase trimerization domain-containing protein [bacterium]
PNAPKTGGRFEMFGCQDNPSYVHYFKGVMRLVALGGYDGAYVDWTKVHEGTCYCEHSRAAFRKYLQEKIPAGYLQKRYGITDLAQAEPPLDNTQALWREWLLFRSASLSEFQREIRAAAREINPDFLLSGNINGGDYGNMAYINGDDMERMGEVEDFFYSEIQSGLRSVPRADGEVKVSNSGPLKFLAAAAMQKPVWMYCIQPSTPKPIPNEKALFNLIKLSIAEAFANHNTFSVVRETFGEPISPMVHNGAEQIYAFFKENEENLVGAKLAANTAILCSINQFYSDEFSYFNPASRVLADAGIAHVMTVERDLNAAELARCKTLILPYVPLMSDEQVKIISAFVEQGGGLVVMGLSSSKDENGLARRNLGLSELLGFSLQDSPVAVTRREVGKGRVVFIPLHPIPVGRGDTDTSPLPDDQMMYGRGIFPDRIKEAFAALPEAAAWAGAGLFSGKLEAEGMVEMTTMEQREKNLQLVHLVNYQVTLDGVVTPAAGARVQLRIPEQKKVTRITIGSPISKTVEVAFKKSGDTIEFVFPPFEIYSLATVYLK